MTTSSSTDYQVIVSADMHMSIRSGPKAALVLYDILKPLPTTDTLLHKLDALGHVVIAPYLPDHAITPEHKFSKKVYFYRSNTAYAPVDDVNWEQALDHAKFYTKHRGIYRVIIANNPYVLAAHDLEFILPKLRTQLNATCGVVIEAYRMSPKEPYTDVLNRYDSELKRIGLPPITCINGMPTELGLVDSHSIVGGAIERLRFATHLANLPSKHRAASRLMMNAADHMLMTWPVPHWEVLNEDILLEAPRLFFTFGDDMFGEGHNWEDM